MTEEFLHYIWSTGSYFRNSVRTASGEPVEVISGGSLNRDSGPDFFNAMIRINGIMLAGNIEMHLNASDWYKHGHHKNKAYDSVILQVVMNRDTEIRRTTGEIIPTAEIRFDKRLFVKYRRLLNDESWIRCRLHIREIDDRVLSDWFSSLAIQRLEHRASLILEILHKNNNNWEESFYQLLFRSFGFSLNGTAFEMLARSLPYNILLRHRNSLFQIEALLFGQAGMLEKSDGDDYYKALEKEYRFLRKKYGLKPLENHLWKFLRLRPSNFPTLRIAQFAALINTRPACFSMISDFNGIKDLSGLFRVQASGYWSTHFLFNKLSGKAHKMLGEFAFRSILINTFAPMLYCYGRTRGRKKLADQSVDLLQKIPPENNCIISGWRKAGIKADNAFVSQALIQQKNEYCQYLRCLGCGIGSHIVSGERAGRYLL